MQQHEDIYSAYHTMMSHYSPKEQPFKERDVLMRLANRFCLAFTEVEEIIINQKHSHHVVHQYNAQQAFIQEAEAYKRTIETVYNRNPTPCECGSTTEVQPRFNPKAYQERRLVVSILCFVCYYSRFLDETPV